MYIYPHIYINKQMNTFKRNVNCTCISHYLSIFTHEIYIASRVARLNRYQSINMSMRTLVGVCVRVSVCVCFVVASFTVALQVKVCVCVCVCWYERICVWICRGCQKFVCSKAQRLQLIFDKLETNGTSEHQQAEWERQARTGRNQSLVHDV